MTRPACATLPLALAICLAAPGCGLTIDLDGPPVRGSGTAASETRAVPGFDRVAIHDAFDVEIEVGPEREVVLEGDDNLLSHVATRVEGRTLDIETDRELRPRAGLLISVRTPRLTGLSSSGSSDVVVGGVEADAFDVHVSGSSDVSASGRFGDLTATVSGSGEIEGEGTADAIDGRVSGSGDLDLAGVRARSAEVRVSGSGEILLDVSERLDADVSGSGKVVYRGDPLVRSSVSGSGSVRRAD